MERRQTPPPTSQVVRVQLRVRCPHPAPQFRRRDGRAASTPPPPTWPRARKSSSWRPRPSPSSHPPQTASSGRPCPSPPSAGNAKSSSSTASTLRFRCRPPSGLGGSAARNNGSKPLSASRAKSILVGATASVVKSGWRRLLSGKRGEGRGMESASFWQTSSHLVTHPHILRLQILSHPPPAPPMAVQGRTQTPGAPLQPSEPAFQCACRTCTSQKGKDGKHLLPDARENLPVPTSSTRPTLSTSRRRLPRPAGRPPLPPTPSPPSNPPGTQFKISTGRSSQYPSHNPPSYPPTLRASPPPRTPLPPPRPSPFPQEHPAMCRCSICTPNIPVDLDPGSRARGRIRTASMGLARLVHSVKTSAFLRRRRRASDDGTSRYKP